MKQALQRGEIRLQIKLLRWVRLKMTTVQKKIDLNLIILLCLNYKNKKTQKK